MRMRLLLPALLIAAAAVNADYTPNRTALGSRSSIKSNTSESLRSSWGWEAGGLYRGVNITLPGVIAAAYPSKTRDLVGAPDWLSRERFDLAARAAFQPSPREREQMLQKLLADRFKLVAHYRSEERAVYRLERVRPGGALGPQLRALSFECDMFKPVGQVPDRLTYGEPPCAIQMRTGGEKVSVVSGGRTMDGLGDTLGGIVGRPVIDRTVLPGYYEFSLEFPAEQTGAPLFTAIKEQLGLKLESAREAVDVLVIDHIERPTEK